MAVVEIIPARASHVRVIAARMRQADRDEVAASSGRSPLAALSYSFRRSAICMTGLIDGRPEVMFGVADLNILAGVGSPWLLGTDAVEENAVAFLRGSVEWRGQLLQRYQVLRNFVDVRNVASVRWLGWLGFQFYDPVMIRGHEFRLFEMRSD